MALFNKTPEEKAAAAEAKALQKEEERRAKLAEQEAKAHAALHKYGIDFDSYSDEDLHAVMVAGARMITGRMAGTGLYEFGSILGGNSDTGMIMTLLKTQIEQNWMLMRQNEQIIRELREIRNNTDGLELAEE